MLSLRSGQLLALVLLVVSPAMAQGTSIEARLRTLTEQNLIATQAEDRRAIADTMHPEAPGYQGSLDLAGRLGKSYDLSYRLLDFRFVTVDGEYAYARVKQETRKLEGPEFADNVLTALWVYRQDGGTWKIWSQAVLEVEFL